MDQPQPRRKRSSAIETMKYIFSAIIIVGGVLGAVGLSMLKQPPDEQNSTLLVPMVRTFSAVEYSGPLDMVVSGSVVPYREIKVAAEVLGRVKRKYAECEAGQFVKKGTTLIEIDPTDYEWELETAKAEVVQSEKSMAETEEDMRGALENLELAQNDYRLQKKEYDRVRGIGNSLSKSELDAAERQLNQSQTNLTGRKNTLESLRARKERMRAALRSAQVREEKARVNLQRCTITAPDDGVIVQEMVEQGDYVNRGTQLFLLEDTSRSEVRCSLTPGELRWIRDNIRDDEPFQEQNNFAVYRLPKTKVEVFEKSHPDVIWSGTLESFDGIGRDELTKSIPCRIVINSPIVTSERGPRALVRGMYVKCRIEIPPSKDAEQSMVAFPSLGLRPGNFVWTVTSEQKLKRVEIDVLDQTKLDIDGHQGEFTIVNAIPNQFAQGASVIVSPVPQPVEGSEVLLESDEDKNKQNEVETTVANIEERSDEPAPEDEMLAIGLRDAAFIAGFLIWTLVMIELGRSYQRHGSLIIQGSVA